MMVKKCLFVGLCAVIIGMTTTLFAGETEIKLKDSTTGSSFSVKDDSDNALLHVQGDGRVGIGTTTPQDLLHLLNSSGSARLRLSSPASHAQFRSFDGGSGHGFMDIDIFPPATTSDAFIRFFRETNTSGSVGILVLNGDNTSSPNAYIAGSGNTYFAVNSGNVGIGTTNPGCKLDVSGSVCSNGTALTSDVRFKKDITPLRGALDKVNSLQGVSYNWRKDVYKERNFTDKRNIGIIAQEVEQIVPEVVHTNQDGYKSVEYSKLVPLLIQAIKEQQEEIRQLKEAIGL